MDWIRLSVRCIFPCLVLQLCGAPVQFWENKWLRFEVLPPSPALCSRLSCVHLLWTWIRSTFPTGFDPWHAFFAEGFLISSPHIVCIPAFWIVTCLIFKYLDKIKISSLRPVHAFYGEVAANAVNKSKARVQDFQDRAWVKDFSGEMLLKISK